MRDAKKEIQEVVNRLKRRREFDAHKTLAADIESLDTILEFGELTDLTDSDVDEIVGELAIDSSPATDEEIRREVRHTLERLKGVGKEARSKGLSAKDSPSRSGDR